MTFSTSMWCVCCLIRREVSAVTPDQNISNKTKYKKAFLWGLLSRFQTNTLGLIKYAMESFKKKSCGTCLKLCVILTEEL